MSYAFTTGNCIVYDNSVISLGGKNNVTAVDINHRLEMAINTSRGTGTRGQTSLPPPLIMCYDLLYVLALDVYFK